MTLPTATVDKDQHCIKPNILQQWTLNSLRILKLKYVKSKLVIVILSQVLQGKVIVLYEI